MSAVVKTITALITWWQNDHQHDLLLSKTVNATGLFSGYSFRDNAIKYLSTNLVG